MKISSSKFNFKFFLSGKVKVTSLDEAAKQYGGATKNVDTGEIFSNVPGGEFIEIQQKGINILSVYIPDTMNVDQAISKEQHQEMLYEIVHRIYKRYGAITPAFERGLGSWYSEELQKVVYDNIIIASIELEDVTQADIKFFISLAKFIKKEMKQEAVTIGINTAIAMI
ncbi:hypothetical protein [Ruminiclostridium josui]|uniref:hypothetical protein n=1 Tax=Ruminiclostridium josui TaxID=1499 RepID=UPI000465BCA6|nr:hypothetical protein [Ruminiclostridium josui]